MNPYSVVLFVAELQGGSHDSPKDAAFGPAKLAIIDGAMSGLGDPVLFK